MLITMCPDVILRVSSVGSDSSTPEEENHRRKSHVRTKGRGLRVLQRARWQNIRAIIPDTMKTLGFSIVSGEGKKMFQMVNSVVKEFNNKVLPSDKLYLERNEYLMDAISLYHREQPSSEMMFDGDVDETIMVIIIFVHTST